MKILMSEDEIKDLIVDEIKSRHDINFEQFKTIEVKINYKSLDSKEAELIAEINYK